MSTPAAILAVMRASRPRCRDSGDVLAYALHAATMAEGYRLLAAGPAAETPENARTDPNVDPSEGWTAWEGAYAFRYARERAVDAASLHLEPPSGTRRRPRSSSPRDPRQVHGRRRRDAGERPRRSRRRRGSLRFPPVRTAEFSLVAHVEPGASCAADAAASFAASTNSPLGPRRRYSNHSSSTPAWRTRPRGYPRGRPRAETRKVPTAWLTSTRECRRSTRRGRTTVARRDGIRRACRRWARGSTRTARQTCPSSPRGVSTADRTSRIIPTRSSEESRDGRRAPFPARVGV